jgi:hypothetical protein
MSKSYRAPSRDFKPLRFDLTERRVRQPGWQDAAEESTEHAELVDRDVLGDEAGIGMAEDSDAPAGAKKWSF